MTNRHGLRIMLAVVLLGANPPGAPAQQYPSKPIRIVNGFAPGGPSDVGARTIAQKLTETWGQQVIVDTRPGAGGNIAAEMVAKSPADGYTLLLGVFAHAVNASLYAKLPFDPIKDFAPIILFASVANVLVVHPSLPVQSVKQLIALAKTQPGQLSCGSAGNGTASHLALELMNLIAGTRINHIPYKGLAPAHTDVVGGQITMLFDGIVTAMPHAKIGRLRMLAVTTAKRWQGAAEVPTMAEAGLPGYEVNSWYGLLAPAGTPRDIIQRLNTEVARGLRAPDARDRLYTIGAEPMADTPEAFAAYIDAEAATTRSRSVSPST